MQHISLRRPATASPSHMHQSRVEGKEEWLRNRAKQGARTIGLLLKDSGAIQSVWPVAAKSLGVNARQAGG